ncbi:hypothetical protein [Alkaliphilus serpentinus]|uniref:Uncharacterized protein n=1 Tax=Alkaliphilus serpentinus TaxID=1482731 RepID=A0A833HPU3_9FIRM|nr:hypothetical protein [Alkaliphilus serpentinus]KAB3531143.1 hypothetical protein F8153_05790 [Alkaliphilus serpentinus]
MTAMNLSLKISSFHMNLDINKSVAENHTKQQRAIEAEININEALKRQESYLKDFSMDFVRM